MKPIMMFMLMSTEFKKIVASIKEDNTDHLARKCRADSAVTRRAAARWRPKQPGAAAGTRAARAPVCSLPRPYPFNNPPTRASDDERPRRMKVGRWQTRARYSDLWKQRSIMSPLGLQPGSQKRVGTVRTQGIRKREAHAKVNNADAARFLQPQKTCQNSARNSQHLVRERKKNQLLASGDRTLVKQIRLTPSSHGRERRWETKARKIRRRTRTARENKGEEEALIPAADSCLHGSAALRNQQVQSLPQPPLYRDARHRKQATSSSPAGSAVLLSSGRV
jgi:hypothetical protein